MGRKLLTVLAGCATLLLAGCQSQKAKAPSPRHVTFNPDEYSPFSGTGSGVIDGQAFLVTRGGEAKKAAGRTVIINPATSYSREWFNRSVINYETLEDGDQRGLPFVRTVQADAEGRFRVEGLPPGEYLIACHITWEVPQFSGGYSYTSQQGGIARGIVTVENGKVSSVIVTR